MKKTIILISIFIFILLGLTWHSVTCPIYAVKKLNNTEFARTEGIDHAVYDYCEGGCVRSFPKICFFEWCN